MIHSYKIEGMHCGSCVAKVEKALSDVENVENVEVSLDTMAATVKMSSHISTNILSDTIKKAGYTLHKEGHEAADIEDSRTWLETYFPLLLIFGFISGISILNQIVSPGFNMDTAMRHFMAGFFIVFSFFKFLNLKAFSDAYAGYDIIAKRWTSYGLIYPFIELTLGILYLINYNPLLTNGLTLLVMGVSTIGVVESLLNKSKIQCACLGAVFDLPMSKVTLIEDLLMVVMAGVMLIVQII
ncbi:MAG: heavy metal-associated domain-containing protein [Bacteroidota bacterium]